MGGRRVSRVFCWGFGRDGVRIDDDDGVGWLWLIDDLWLVQGSAQARSKRQTRPTDWVFATRNSAAVYPKQRYSILVRWENTASPQQHGYLVLGPKAARDVFVFYIAERIMQVLLGIGCRD
jgi:hypothetical protein